jgi:histidine triad (HIT) family protein
LHGTLLHPSRRLDVTSRRLGEPVSESLQQIERQLQHAVSTIMVLVPLKVPVEPDCSFCAYLGGRRSYTVMEHTQQVSLLVTREQRGVGPVLVIPTTHRPTLLDLQPHDMGALMLATERVATAITAAYDVEGICLWQNNGVPAHQSIPHVHFQAGTLPAGGTQWGPVRKLNLEETDIIASELSRHLPPAPAPAVTTQAP